MKKLLFILAFVIVAIAANAQRGREITLDPLVLNGTGTVDSDIIFTSGSYNSVSFQAVATQTGGTTEGTLALYSSNDGTSYVLVSGVGAGLITASPVASLTGADLNQMTLVSGLIMTWDIKGSPNRHYKLTGVGAVNDSTSIAIKVILK